MKPVFPALKASDSGSQPVYILKSSGVCKINTLTLLSIVIFYFIFKCFIIFYFLVEGDMTELHFFADDVALLNGERRASLRITIYSNILISIIIILYLFMLYSLA